MTQLEALLASQRIETNLLLIKQALDRKDLKEPNMAVSAPVAALITEFDAATNAIAARIQTLINNSGTLSADDQAALQTEVTNLQALGKDPNAPIPPPA